MQRKKKTFNRLDILIATYTMFFALAPILSTRIVDIFGAKLIVGSLGMLLGFGILDVINNAYGKDKARQTVLTAAVVRVIIFSFIGLSLLFPTFYQPKGYLALLGQSIRIMIAGELSLLISQYFIDVPVFSWIKEKIPMGFWFRYNLSNLCSQFVSIAVFLIIAFIGTNKPLLNMIFSQFIFKTVISFVMTPIFVVLGNWVRHERINCETK